MKHFYKTKVLLCTRTTQALTEIGFKLCEGTINFVIIGKHTDTHQQLRKYELDNLAAKTLSEDNLGDEESNGRLLENAKIDIIRNCDKIISLIQNAYDDLVAKACTDGDCIAQMCCIICEANLCTEPEILIPLLHGISKLILIIIDHYFIEHMN
ncbi:AAA_11 domain-containing protein [Caerostris extrusa]|uniref:AAA_11 domain-containing protein n=1 Tax=Caerostris extrusa TaxID=172846 RepID=A0AAV4VJ22_CAEEX|nr:AAA_11 domain-containing protein [Caerostris extrusa]